MCFNNEIKNFNLFKSSLEFWGIRDLKDIKNRYIKAMFEENRHIYIITEYGKVHKIKKLKIIKNITNANIKFNFIDEETYYSLYALDKDSKKLYYELMEN